MEEQRKQSDQLPEEGPPEQVPEDTPKENGSRKEADDSPGVPDDPNRATGHPDEAD